MNDALTKALYDEFLQLYSGHTKSAEHSSMSWGFECGNGWYALLRRLSRQLTDYARQNPGFQLEAIQVKAKVGELKFYLAQRSETTDALIEQARETARHTCELSGEPGSLCEPGQSALHGGQYTVLSEKKAAELGFQKVTSRRSL